MLIPAKSTISQFVLEKSIALFLNQEFLEISQISIILFIVKFKDLNILLCPALYCGVKGNHHHQNLTIVLNNRQMIQIFL